MLLVSMNTNFGCSLSAYMEGFYTVSKILEFPKLNCRHCACAMIQINAKKMLGRPLLLSETRNGVVAGECMWDLIPVLHDMDFSTSFWAVLNDSKTLLQQGDRSLVLNGNICRQALFCAFITDMLESV